MNKLFSTKGRINRKNYLISYLLCIAIGIGIGLISMKYFPTMFNSIKGISFWFLCFSPFIYISYCTTVKRLHDLDRPSSDFWLLCQPFRNWDLEYRLLLEAGTYGKNQYGYPQNPPKGKPKTVRY